MKYDYVTLYEKNVKFYKSRPKAKRFLRLSNTLLTVFFCLAYATLLILTLIDLPDVYDLTQILGVPTLAFLLSSTLRVIVDRNRPYDEDGANITPLVPKKNAKKSFPSRHAACASAIAVLFFSFIPAVGALLAVLTLGVAYVRFAVGLHYPSDLAAGVLVGVISALLGLLI